eukprot:Phypoly_transcript_06064.p1 GENE.Phypoly_transcript_06064~~Phypoly_transcript_06064.p1  ORF type:complete len:297 (+),score=87.30 Phypoly_transcript_06064:873-1763(+)
MSKQDELRQLMKKGQAERKSKVDSPFAKYNAAGQLQCSLCGTAIKTEALWPVHIKSKTHKENQAQLEQSQKKAASKAAAPSSSKASNDTKRERTDDTNLMPPPPAKKAKDSQPTPSGLPAGFFDSYADEEEDKEEDKEEEEGGKSAKTEEAEAPAQPPPPKSSLPAGFFDDPTMDAQMRGAKTPAKLKEEAIDKMYEKYQEVLGEELKNAEKIQVEELLKDESVDADGDNEIIDREQERREREEKMLELKKKAERVKELKQKLSAAKPKVVEVGDDDLISPDAFYDWRAKSSKLNA